MKRCNTGDPKRLTYREPVGWGVLFTIPIFGVVATFVWFMTSSFFDGFLGLPGYGQLLLGALALFIVYKGVRLAIDFFGCVGASIDLHDGTVTSMWGFFLPIPMGNHKLSESVALLMDFMVIDHGRYTESWYILYWLGSGDRRVRLGRSRDYAPVRAMAETAGRFAGLDVIDATGSSVVVLRSEMLGLSLKEQTRYRGEVALPTPPATMTSSYKVEDGDVVVQMPLNCMMGCLVIWVLLVVGFASLLTYFFVAQGIPWQAIAFYGAIGGVMLAIFYGAAAPERTTLIIGNGRMEIANAGMIFTSRKKIQAERVREIRDEMFGLQIITDSESVTVGGHLPLAERDWLRQLLQRELAA